MIITYVNYKNQFETTIDINLIEIFLYIHKQISFKFLCIIKIGNNITM